MSFNPRAEYQIVPKSFSLRKFHFYKDKFITRPPYQRKTVWSQKKKQALIDSIFRRYYVPKLVIREVRLSDERTVDEIIDGQQRITTLQEFYDGKIKLPKTLKDLSKDLPGKLYDELDGDLREYFDELELQSDRILNIDDPKNREHQRVATEIFWRLQQGESLNSMEVAHARLSSRIRNFLVKYSDDISFNYSTYLPIDQNPHKHKFFKIVDRKNNRMEHLAMLARMLLIEQANGATDLKDSAIITLIENAQVEDGIGDETFENDPSARSVIQTLNLMYELFEDDPMVVSGGTVKELNREYFIISFYMLVRHLKGHYVIDDILKSSLHSFFIEFFARWKSVTLDDRDMSEFSESRQQGANDVRTREIIIRQLFFDYLAENDLRILAKDEKRSFSEAERIRVYRNASGLCVMCLNEGKSEKEALVPWNEFDADHVLPHSKGGKTDLENSQLLCNHHNRSKGAN